MVYKPGTKDKYKYDVGKATLYRTGDTTYRLQFSSPHVEEAGHFMEKGDKNRPVFEVVPNPFNGEIYFIPVEKVQRTPEEVEDIFLKIQSGKQTSRKPRVRFPIGNTELYVAELQKLQKELKKRRQWDKEERAAKRGVQKKKEEDGKKKEEDPPRSLDEIEEDIKRIKAGRERHEWRKQMQEYMRERDQEIQEIEEQTQLFKDIIEQNAKSDPEYALKLLKEVKKREDWLSTTLDDFEQLKWRPYKNAMFPHDKDPSLPKSKLYKEWEKQGFWPDEATWYSAYVRKMESKLRKNIGGTSTRPLKAKKH